MATLTIQDNTAIVEYRRTKLELTRESHTGHVGSNCWELIFEDGNSLDLEDLKALNEVGFVYHSEQTDIDYENEDGTTSYMDIFYFALVENTQELFQDCVPF